MTEHFEYVFVGSGIAAITTARRILEAQPGASILMLDAGPEVVAKDRRYWWDYLITGRKPYDYTYDVPGENTTQGDIKWGFAGARAMVYGGSTIHWGAWSVRYKPEDFELKQRTGEGADWPFGYDTLAPYYTEAEHYMSVCGCVGESWNQVRKDDPYPRPPFEWTAADGVMIQAFDKLGIEPGKMPIARYRHCMTTGTCKYCPFGARFSAQYVLDELRANPAHTGFEQRCHAPVTRLRVGAEKSRIEAIEYLDTGTGDVRTVTADTFVVAAGTYESAKLLRASIGGGWESGIGNDHDLLGRFIVSHSFLRVRGSTPRNPEHWVQEYDFPTLMSRTYDAPEYQNDGKIFLFKNRVLPNTDIAKLMIEGKTREEILQILSGEMTIELQAFYEEKGQHRNRLVARPGRNKFGLPLTTIEYRRDPRFVARANQRLGLMKKVFEAMEYKVQEARFDDPGGHHATSTCRMGRDETEGVTDENLRVFGTRNLYVCSNAAFPTCTAVNPTLTLAAMAMRLGDHLVPRRAPKEPAR